MNKLILMLLIVASLLYSSLSLAETNPRPIINPIPPATSAKSYILIDADSGKILAEKNATEKSSPASLTKLMTMYVISDAIKRGVIHPDDKVRVSKKAWKTGGSRMFIKVNDEVPVHELLKGIVVVSGNDATVAMAEYIAGTETAFTGLMNSEATRLGMTNSHFADSNGLPDPDHYSSAKDLAILSRAIIRDFPEDYELYASKWFKWNNIRQPNRNRLLWHFPNADGLKTGHTNAAGFCLVGSAKKNTTRLISVILGEPSDQARTEDSIKLLTYGFRFFETHKIYQGRKKLISARIWEGVKKNTPLGLAEPLFITLPIGQFQNIKTHLTLNKTLRSPIEKGQTYGKLTVTLNEKLISTAPLIALETNKKGGFWRRMTDTIHFSFNKLFYKNTENTNHG